MRDLRTIKLSSALLFAPGLAFAANPGVTLSVQVTPAPPNGGGTNNPQIVQSLMQVLYPQYPDLVSSYTLNLPKAVQVGDNIFGAGLYEPNAGNGTTYGSVDTVMVGTQQAIIDDNGITGGFGPAMFTFHLLHVNNPAATITYSASNGGNFLFEDQLFAEISGLSATASLDTHAAAFSSPLPSSGLLSSGNVTPSVPGDFLFAAGFIYDFGETPLQTPDNSWTLISNCGTVPGECTNSSFDPGQIYKVYNSTAPVSAMFLVPADAGSNESWAGVIAIKP